MTAVSERFAALKAKADARDAERPRDTRRRPFGAVVWEYAIVDFENNDTERTDYNRAETEFNQMGADGWELVNVTFNCKAYFKRPKPP